MLTVARKLLVRAFDYSGRSAQPEYFIYLVIAILLAVLGPLMFIAVIPGIAVTVRRLHDMDRSGLWILLLFAPLFFHLSAITLNFGNEATWRFTFFAFVFMPVAFFVWMTRPGTPGPNRFGEPPIGLMGEATSPPATR